VRYQNFYITLHYEVAAHSLVWLEVPMYNAVAVQIFQRQYHLSRVHSAYTIVHSIYMVHCRVKR